jgi:hypothetical protein
VIEGPDGTFVGIETKSSSSVDSGDFKGLRSLANIAKEGFHRGIVMYSGQRTLSFAPNLFAVPIAALWRRPQS